MSLPAFVPEERRRSDRKRSILLLLVLYAVVGLAVVLVRSRQARNLHRLKAFRGDGYIYQGNIYFLADPGTGGGLLYQAVTGGEVHKVAATGPHTTIRLLNSRREFAPDTIVYGTIPQPASLRGPDGGTVGGMAINPNYLGEFRAPAQPIRPERSTESRRATSGQAAADSLPLMRIGSADIRGGATRDLAEIAADSYALVGRSIYWIRSYPNRVDHRRRANRTWDEVAGSSELWMTSLADRSSHLLTGGLLADTHLVGGTEGVFWAEPHVYPDMDGDLCYWRETENRLHRIVAYGGNLHLSEPVEYGGRLYWLVCDHPDEPWRADRLISANLDGGDRRSVFSFVDTRHEVVRWQQLGDYGPKWHEGALYCLCHQAADERLSEERRRIYLCRLHPERANPLEVALELPPGSSSFVLDQRYIYFDLMEEHQKLWDRLTGDVANVKTTVVTCRMELPSAGR